jgi:hypothetical protein
MNDNKMNENINKLFSHLDKWRHFPAYQLERRADIFFSIYLPDFLKSEKGYDVESMIPEFPIRIGTINSQIDINKSYKVDYLIKPRNHNRVLFIELKTDSLSRRTKQDDYLIAAKEVGMYSLLNGLKNIYKDTYSKNKYKHLLRELDLAGFIRFTDERDFEIVDNEYEISIIYLQPNGCGDDVITFQQLANFIETNDDYLSKRFAKSLKEWSSTIAGANGK